MLKLEAVQEYQINQIITYLANFEGEIRGEKFWRNRLKSWWEDNPCYNSNFCRGWVLLDSKKSIVGFIGNIPRTFLVKGEPIIVNNASTWRVVDQYRSKAILLFQELINSSRSTILFNTTPTNKVEKMLNILNFNKINICRSTVIPICIPDNSKNKFLKLLKPFSPIINVLLSSINKKLFPDSVNFQSKLISEDEISIDFDILWENTKNKYPNTLIRDSKKLKWFIRNQVTNEKQLISCYKDEKLVGYAIFIIKNHLLYLIDYWAVNEDRNILKSIISQAIEYCRVNRKLAISLVHLNSHINNMFEKIYFLKFKYETKLYFKTSICNYNDTNTYSTLLLGDLNL